MARVIRGHFAGSVYPVASRGGGSVGLLIGGFPCGLPENDVEIVEATS